MVWVGCVTVVGAEPGCDALVDGVLVGVTPAGELVFVCVVLADAALVGVEEVCRGAAGTLPGARTVGAAGAAAASVV